MMEELAQRAVACRHWRWMPGMLAIDFCNEEHPARVIDAHRSVAYEDNDGAIHEGDVSRSDVPDLTDPATLGCLLALVREVAQEPGLHVRCMLPYAPDMSGKTPPPWVLHSGRGQRWSDRYDTEAEALVAALEAAP